ncbi:MAG TPA: YdhR family protein [Gaiellaceae bacterium]
MIVRLVLWNLADSKTNIAELRRYLADEGVDVWSDVPGLLFKAWISDESSERWGAIFVYESQEAAEQSVQSRTRELIGKQPDVVEVFDLEATTSVSFELSRLGLAFE